MVPLLSSSFASTFISLDTENIPRNILALIATTVKNQFAFYWFLMFRWWKGVRKNVEEPFHFNFDSLALRKFLNFFHRRSVEVKASLMEYHLESFFTSSLDLIYFKKCFTSRFCSITWRSETLFQLFKHWHRFVNCYQKIGFHYIQQIYKAS